MMSISRVGMIIALSLVSLGAWPGPVVYDSGNDHDKKNQGSAKGSYTITVDGDKLKIHLTMETSRQGINGTSRGLLRFLILEDKTDKIIWSRQQTLTVGADAIKGSAKKNYDETFTVFGPPAKAVLKNGGTIAFDISLDVDSGLPSNLKELSEDIKKNVDAVTGVLEVGKSTPVGGWVFKKVAPFGG